MASQWTCFEISVIYIIAWRFLVDRKRGYRGEGARNNVANRKMCETSKHQPSSCAVTRARDPWLTSVSVDLGEGLSFPPGLALSHYPWPSRPLPSTHLPMGLLPRWHVFRICGLRSACLQRNAWPKKLGEKFALFHSCMSNSILSYLSIVAYHHTFIYLPKSPIKRSKCTTTEQLGGHSWTTKPLNNSLIDFLHY